MVRNLIPMNAFTIYRYVEFITFMLYLIFIFISIQIWFLWKDINKNRMTLNTFVNDSFFKKNCFYVFLFSIFFMIHEFLEDISFPDSMVYFEFLDMLTILSLLLFAYLWYSVLKTCASKKTLPKELIDPINH
jgi:hypothetical protein